ncbi:MAG: hypothetical protein QME45_06460 [Clostridiales bacterium]|nr:hypothetical protein [Clostridiales bacterium]HBM79616.1 hypothetical protein [Clostridiaceae bacterium]
MYKEIKGPLKCDINPLKGCVGYCCKFCMIASECTFACPGDPSECGKKIQWIRKQKNNTLYP